jgi:hypothetical protein
MASLRRVASTVAQFFYRDTCFIYGNYTGVNNAAGTGLFKGLVVMARTGEGVYTITLLAADGVTALKGFHLKNLTLIPVAPASTDGLSGPWEITTDAINASGVITITTRNQAFAAADIIGLVKVALQISPEAAS